MIGHVKANGKESPLISKLQPRCVLVPKLYLGTHLSAQLYCDKLKRAERKARYTRKEAAVQLPEQERSQMEQGRTRARFSFLNFTLLFL